MGLIDDRRRILSGDRGSYIRRGLILWMDGIEKGNTSGAWTDRVSGHVFEAVDNGFTDGANYVGLNGSQSLRCATFAPPSTRTYTVEVAISDYGSSGILFMPKTAGACFGYYIDGSHTIALNNAGDQGSITEINCNEKLFGLEYDLAALDGAQKTVFGHGRFAGPDSNYSYIGRRNYGSNKFWFTGKVYAIRIYNRLLSLKEIYHNQRIDNLRFTLGLNI